MPVPCQMIPVRSLFHPLSAATYGEALQAGLLQLAGSLIRLAQPQLIEHRKELLSFGWNHLKRDGSSCKYHAFLAVARFLVAFHAPEKITLQVRLHASQQPFISSAPAAPCHSLVALQRLLLVGVM